MSIVQANFDEIYAVLLGLLNRFYPEQQITVTSTDPHFVTPAIKAMLRRKNKLMRSGRTEEADAIAKQVRAAVTRQSSSWLRTGDTRKRTKETWAKEREVIQGCPRVEEYSADGITAQTLNDHYAAISTDLAYTSPQVKSSQVY